MDSQQGTIHKTLFQARYGLAGYATVVIRAESAKEAWEIAVEHGKQYIGEDVGGVSVDGIPLYGPSEVIIEDWS